MWHLVNFVWDEVRYIATRAYPKPMVYCTVEGFNLSSDECEKVGLFLEISNLMVMGRPLSDLGEFIM